MRKKIPAIIVDLDGTLSDSRHREKFVTDRPKDWEGFYRELVNDPPNDWCVQICKRFSEDHNIIFVTGRPQKYESATVAWIGRTLGWEAGWDYCLYCREDDNHEPDHEFKERIFKEYIQPYFDVLFCVEDRSRVVDMWRRLGLPCLQCAKGDF